MPKVTLKAVGAEILMDAVLNFFWFAKRKPTDEQEGLHFLIYLPGGIWELGQWGAERGLFFNDSGDYFEFENENYYWAQLPNNI